MQQELIPIFRYTFFDGEEFVISTVAPSYTKSVEYAISALRGYGDLPVDTNELEEHIRKFEIRVEQVRAVVAGQGVHL